MPRIKSSSQLTDDHLGGPEPRVQPDRPPAGSFWTIWCAVHKLVQTFSPFMPGSTRLDRALPRGI